jgi:hypothetical protein
MRWVMVAGTGRQVGLSEKVRWFDEAIGYRLGFDGFGLVVGGWPGVDYVVAANFARGLAEGAPNVPRASRLLQVIRAGTYPDFQGGHVVYVPWGSLEWLEGLRYAKAVILIGGEGGTYQTFTFATQERVPVFPIAKTGGDAERVSTASLPRGESSPLGASVSTTSGVCLRVRSTARATRLP